MTIDTSAHLPGHFIASHCERGAFRLNHVQRFDISSVGFLIQVGVVVRRLLRERRGGLRKLVDYVNHQLIVNIHDYTEIERMSVYVIKRGVPIIHKAVHVARGGVVVFYVLHEGMGVRERPRIRTYLIC